MLRKRGGFDGKQKKETKHFMEREETRERKKGQETHKEIRPQVEK